VTGFFLVISITTIVLSLACPDSSGVTHFKVRINCWLQTGSTNSATQQQMPCIIQPVTYKQFCYWLFINTLLFIFFIPH